MIDLLHIIKGTPFYVWVILTYLLFIGIKSLKTRIVYLPKVFIIPLVLLSIRYKAFLSQGSVAFILVIVLSAILSFYVYLAKEIRVIKKSQSVEVPGGYSTLVILVSYFLVKYYFGYLESSEPDLALKYSFLENTISGALSGYFIGRAVSYIYKYLKA